MESINSFSKSEFDNLIMEISTNLFSSKTENMKNVINTSLKMLVGKLGVDRVYIFKMSKNRTGASKVFEAKNSKLKSHKVDLQNIPYESISYLVDKLKKNRVIKIENLQNDIMNPVTNNRIFSFHKPESTIVLPLMDRDKLSGFWGIDYNCNNFQRTEDAIVFFKITGTLINSAIMKFESKEKLKKMNKTLTQNVKKEVDKNNKQAKMMFQQAKYAQMGEMLSMIAHQWRQPLNAVSSAAVNLKLDVEFGTLTDRKVVEKAEFIEEQSEKMSETINDFMEFFKPEKSKEKFCVYRIFQNVQKIIGAQMENRNIELYFDIDENMEIYGYKNEFEHVILNLISNARDAFDGKEIKNKRIEFAAYETKTKKIITVKDNGGGVESKVIDKIFNPYFTTKIHSKGTGIGLYMTRSIIERNFHGKIEVSNTNDGAVFTIRIRNG